MRRTGSVAIALLILLTTSAASASQCSDRHLEEFNSQGGKDIWLKRVRSMQNQAKQALRTGVWSDGKKLSHEELRQIREGVQGLEEDIAEASTCSLPERSASTPLPTPGNRPTSAASNCPASITLKHYGILDEFRYKGGNNIELWSGGSLTGTISMSPDDTYIGYMEPPAKAAMINSINCLRSTKTALGRNQGNSGTPSAGETRSELSVGNASEVTGQRANRKNDLKHDSQTAQAEMCICGPNYIACHERNCKRGSGRCQVFRENGYTSIVSYDQQGRKLDTHVWRGGNKCGAQAY